MRILNERIKFITGAFLLLALSGCVEPIAPEFQFEDGLIYIDAFVSSNTGGSFATISESREEFGVQVVRFVPDAMVRFNNVDTGVSIALTEAEDTYLPPDNFTVSPGENWKLSVTLANGAVYESLPEQVLNPVAITDLAVRYDPELVFREIFGGKFVPGHAISISLEDPAGEENNYYWSYRSFENIDYCRKCVDGIFRRGDCQPANLPGFGSRYYDYICETDCWRIRFPESVAIFQDEFSDGKTVSNFPIGDLLLYTKQNMVVEVQQFSLSRSAYDYYKVLKDLVDNSGGLNAPPPAALVGNLFNPDDSEDLVLGRFTAAASSVASVFIERSTGILEPPLETRDPIVLEPLVGSPFPPPATNFAPCSESKFRTAKEPNGWINP